MHLYLYKLEAIYLNETFTYYGSRKSKISDPYEDSYMGSPKSNQGVFIFKNPNIKVTKTILETGFKNYEDLLIAEKILILKHYNDLNNLNFSKNTSYNFHTSSSKPRSSKHNESLKKSKLGSLNPQFGKLRTPEEKMKISKALKGKIPYNKGLKLGPSSDEHRLKRGAAQRAKSKITCPHCLKIGADNLMKRYHFDNCKFITLPRSS